MKYRILGRTDLKVSELGVGGHEYRRHLNSHDFNVERNMNEFIKTQSTRNKLIKSAFDAGINYFDTTLEEEAESLGLALKSLGRRKEVYMSAMIIFPFQELDKGTNEKWKDIISRGVEKRLRQLQTDYIDIFTIHMPEDSYSIDKFKVTMEALGEKKKQGKIGFIGASSHDLKFLAELIRKFDCFDSVMVPYNYHQQEARHIIFPLRKVLNIGIVIMKPLSWPYYGIPFTYFYLS